MTFTKSEMKAAVLYGPSDVKVEMVNIPDYGDDEVLVRVKKIGVCPSDVRTYLGIYKHLPPYGKISYGFSGHEWTGEVAEIGKNVKNLKVGDHVVVEHIIPCGICKFCRKGLTHLCKDKGNVMRGYAEYVKSPAKALLKLPDNVSFEEAAFSEPVAVVLHCNEIISVRPSDTVLVIGGGPMGILHTQVSKLSGATVIVSEVIDTRLKVAKDFGADFVINPIKEDMPKKVKELTDGYGADAVILAVGNKAAIESGFRAISSAGTLVLFGGTYPPATIEIDPNVIHYGELKVTGSFDHIPAHMEGALRLMSRKSIDLKRMISNTFPLDQIKEAFELVKSGNALKVQVEP